MCTSKAETDGIPKESSGLDAGVQIDNILFHLNKFSNYLIHIHGLKISDNNTTFVLLFAELCTSS